MVFRLEFASEGLGEECNELMRLWFIGRSAMLEELLGPESWASVTFVGACEEGRGILEVKAPDELRERVIRCLSHCFPSRIGDCRRAPLEDLES